MTLKDIQKKYSKSERQVYKWVTMGLPFDVINNEKAFDETTVDEWVKTCLKKTGGQMTAVGIDIAEARRRREIAMASLAEMKVKQLNGTLQLKSEAIEQLTACLIYLRNKLSGLPSYIAPRLQGLLVVPDIERKLQDELNAVLLELSKKLGSNGNN